MLFRSGLLLTALEEIRANRIQAEIDESEMASQRAAQALYILGQGLKNYGNAVYGPAGLILSRKKNW